MAQCNIDDLQHNEMQYGNLSSDNELATIIVSSVISRTSQSSGSSCDMYGVLRCETDVRVVGYIVILPIICAIGICIKVCHIAVLKRGHIRLGASTRLAIMAQAVFETMTLVLSFPRGFFACVNATQWAELGGSIYTGYVMYLAYACSSISVWIMVLITLERYVLVAWPVKARLLSHRQRRQYFAVYVCICVSLMIILQIPNFFATRITSCGRLQITTFGLSDGYKVYGWFRLVFAKMLPVLLISILNAMLGRAAYQAYKRCCSMVEPTDMPTERDKLQTRISITTLSISMVYLIVHSLESIAQPSVFVQLFGGCSIASDPYLDFLLFQLLLEYVSYTANFLFFCVFRREFFHEVTNLLCCRTAQETPLATPSVSCSRTC